MLSGMCCMEGLQILTDVLLNMPLYIGIYSMWFVAVLVLLTDVLDMPVQAYFQERSINYFGVRTKPTAE